MYHTKKIGVFISHIFGHYQKNVCQGIIDKALEYGYNVEIFTTFDGENLDSFGIGDESVLRIPNYEELDGVIFASETYLSAELRQKIAKHLDDVCSSPIIEIAKDDYRFPTVSIDNNTNTLELMDHLINTHGYKRICYFGCTTEAVFSDNREELYKKSLAKYHIPCGPNDIYHGDYTKESSLAALLYFFKTGAPDAVVCYNDRLALNFMEAALERGIQIPTDIAVTGFDHSDEGQNISPMLTTVSFPVYELGECAVLKLISLIQGNKIEKVTTIHADTIFHNSCGCHTNSDKNPVFYMQELSGRISLLESSIFDSMNMSASLQYAKDIDDAVDLLEKCICQSGIFQEFYLCLYSDWDLVSDHIMELTNTEDSMANNNSITLKLAIKNQKRLPECTYQKRHPLPEYICKSSDCAYLYSPLFFGDKEFGYTAIGFDKNQISYRFYLIQWHLNINHMLQNIYESKRTGLLVAKLEDIYMRDPLTGFLNKHGYNYYEEQFLNNIALRKLPLCAFLFDMNGLKKINDTYGHSEGDFAIRVIGHALESIMKKDDICARFSNDEFYLLSPDTTRANAEELLETIQKYLNNYNKLSNKGYTISCSYGYACALSANEYSHDSIQELFEQADKMMYRMKTEHYAKLPQQ